MVWTISLYAMAALYVLAGLNHFRAPGFYLPMMPPYLPFPEALNYAAGGVEIVLGLALLNDRARPFAAWAIIAMLVVFISVHVYMLQERHEKFARFSQIFLWARVPLQGVLIAWAWIFTKL
jgi:uncharacterized membrane protein